jgi:protein-L-isoaspartate(D-aspartate) O-methyltransferase
MVKVHLARRGIVSPMVLQAMSDVPRHLFVPEYLRPQAYNDCALPLPDDQTISQPYIVALMVQTLDLKGTERVLDIGTGSGYAAAVLSLLAKEVYSVERSETLTQTARARLGDLGYQNIHVLHYDGTNGLPQYAPYNAIHVAAASPWVPRPLRDQLAEGGRMVIPVGSQCEQLLLRAHKTQGETKIDQLGGVRFVPLVGEHAWGTGFTAEEN